MEIFRSKIFVVFLILAAFMFISSPQPAHAGGVARAVGHVVHHVAHAVAEVVHKVAHVIKRIAHHIWCKPLTFLSDCEGVTGNQAVTKNGNIIPPPNLVVSVLINGSSGPVTLNSPASPEIKWAISGINSSTSCFATGNWSASITKAYGKVDIVNLSSGSHNYGVRCTKGAKTVSDSVIVNVIPPSATLYAPQSVNYGNSLNLTWNSVNSSSCVLKDQNNNIISQSTKGSINVNPSSSYYDVYTNYALACKNSVENATNQSVSVFVKVPCSISLRYPKMLQGQSNEVNVICSKPIPPRYSCSISNLSNSIDISNGSYSKVIKSLQNTGRYILSCINSAGKSIVKGSIGSGIINLPNIHEVVPGS